MSPESVSPVLRREDEDDCDVRLKIDEAARERCSCEYVYAGERREAHGARTVVSVAGLADHENRGSRLGDPSFFLPLASLVGV